MSGAGEIIEARCLEEDAPPAECAERAATARQNFVDAPRNAGVATVPAWKPEIWQDSGQCRDCFQPSFNYRPRSSVQYLMALGRPEQSVDRFRLGFIASSDNHSARPGTGYKEFGLSINTEARQLIRVMSELGRPSEEPLAESRRLSWEDVPDATLKEAERFNSFWYTGGLVAVHADSRGREAIWDALKRKEVYGTSGPRILLWFDRVEPDRFDPRQSRRSERDEELHGPICQNQAGSGSQERVEQAFGE